MPTSSYYLMASNLAPLVGVLFFGWDAFAILLLYWAETLAVGFWWLLKIGLSSGNRAWFLVPFLLVHSGIFFLAEGIFIFLKFPWNWNLGYYANLIWLPWLCFFVSHGVSFFLNSTSSNATIKKNKIQPIPSGPYERLITMHIIIAICFSFSYFFRSQMAIIILVFFKTTADLRGHLREHRQIIGQTK